MLYQKIEMNTGCIKCGSKFYQNQCVNPACPNFSSDAAFDYIEDELLPDMCLDFEGFAARQSTDKTPLNYIPTIANDGAPVAAAGDRSAAPGHQTPVDGASR